MDYESIEATILKGFIQDRHLITLAAGDGFVPELLRHPSASRLCKAVLELHTSRGGVVDQVTVRNHLDGLGLLNAEMDRYLGAVMSMKTIDAGRLMAFIETLKNRESRERLSAVREQIDKFLGGAEHSQRDIVQLTADVMQQLLDVQKVRVRTRIRPASGVFGALVQEAERRAGQGNLLGYSLEPFERLTAVLSGLRRGFYYGIAGAPRRGKTNFTLQLATYLARNHHVPVLFYSWEQTSNVLGARLIAKETGINPAAILAGSDPQGQPVAPLVRAAQERMAEYASYLFLVEAGRQDTLGRIRAHAYNVMQEFQTDQIVLVFDYLQKIPLAEGLDDWKARTDRISTELAELSLELNVPIVAISPLDKEGCRLDERPAEEEEAYSPYERPTMHHSVGSGDLEYDLDVAMVLAKDWRGTAELRQFLESRAKAAGTDPDTLPQIDIINLHIDKNRDAPESAANTIQYAFFVTLNKFVELDYKLEREYRPEFHAFGKLQTIYAHLRDTGVLPLAAIGR